MYNVFTAEELANPGFFKRLLKQQLVENAIVEVNNLLATKPLMDIVTDEVQEIGARYNVDLHEVFSDQLKDMYRLYLNKCLEDNAISNQEIDELRHLSNLLLLDDEQVTTIHDELTSDIYKQNYDDVLNNTQSQTEKEVFIAALQQNLRMPDAQVARIKKASNDYFMDAQLDKIMDDKQVSDEEWNEFTKLAEQLGVNMLRFQASKDKLEKYRFYWTVASGQLPVFETALSLQKDEICHYAIKADWVENVTYTKEIKYSVESNSMTFSDGVRKEWGTQQVERITEDKLTATAYGTFYLTNKRMIFVGSQENYTIPLSNVLSLTKYSNGIGIDRDSGKKIIILVDENADMLNIIAARIINQEHKEE